jgi:DNA-binding transcriptional LysR family regulator
MCDIKKPRRARVVVRAFVLDKRQGEETFEHAATSAHILLAPVGVKSTSVSMLLKKERYPRFDATQRTGMVIDRALRRHGLKANTFLELSSLEGLVALVRQGVGVAIVPLLRHSTWDNEETLRVLRLPGETEHRTVGMLERAQHDKRSITVLLAQHLKPAG